jgi:UPF0288 family protein (methanogenesis marker protein 3)
MDTFRDSSTAVAPAVRLSVPASRAHVRVARLTAAVVAERLDFDIDEIDDTLVAVDELTNALIDSEPVSEIDFRFAHLDGAFVAEGSATVRRSPRLTELARQVLGVVVDGFELSDHAGLAHFRVTKRSSPDR